MLDVLHDPSNAAPRITRREDYQPPGLPGRHGGTDLRACSRRHAGPLRPHPAAQSRGGRSARPAAPRWRRPDAADGDAGRRAGRGRTASPSRPATWCCATRPMRSSWNCWCASPPASNTELSGLYVSGGNFFTQCEAEGFRRHHLLPGPAGRDGALHHRHRRRPRAGAVLLSNGNLVDSGTMPDGPPTGPSGRTRTRSPATCSPWWPASWWRCATASPPRPAARWRWGSMCVPATRTNAPTRCTA